MAPSFFSKLAKATTSSSTTSNGDSTTATTTTKNATTDTKAEKRRSSASRDRSSGTTKSTKSINDTPSNTHTPRSSFQFGISTLTRAASRNRAASSPSAANGKHSAHNSTTNLHRKVESDGATPPVPPVPDTLTATPLTGTTRGRRNSIISVVFGGGKTQDNSSIVPQEPSADSSAIQGLPSIQLDGADDDDDDIPRIGIVGSASRESLTSSASELGVTIIPPSPLVYTASLPSTQSSIHEFPAAVEEAPTIPGPEHNSTQQQPSQEATPLATPTQEQPATSTTASVLVSIFGRRARTTSISSAISGIIGVGAPTKDKPAPVEVINDEPDSNGVSPVTPTTATTIKAHPLPTKETPPPLPATKADGNMAPSTTLSPGHEVQRKASSRSLTNVPPPIIVPDHGASLSPAGSSSKSGTHHARAATTPAEGVHDNAPPTVTMTPIVESPTALKSEFLISASTSSSSKDQRNRAASTSAQSTGGGFTGMLSPKRGGDDDTASIISTASKSPGKEDKKRLFKRSTTRKPTGLASAIAATGLAMANPSISAMHSAQMNAAAASQADTKSPYLSKSPTASVVSAGQRSATSVVSPRSGKSTGRKVSGGSTGKSPSSSSFALNSAGSRKASRRPSMSAYSDTAASTGGLSVGGAPSEYYSGNESGEGVRPRRRPTLSASRVGGHSGDESDTEDEDSSEEDSSDDDDVLDDLDLEDDDIPVTGFAVASNKRNADFHELFPNVPEGDYLIEDYGCALQREILIQGRLYISENHICFHANIFGWITDLSIPIDEITTLEKKMTAFVIPNAIQITTRQSRYSFASFLSRDTTYDVIYNIWRLARPDDIRSIRSGQSLGNGSHNGLVGPGVIENGVGSSALIEPGVVKKVQKKATHCACGREGRHYTEIAMEATFPGSPEMIHNLMFASGFIKEFLTVDQKLLDIQMADWMPVNEGSNLLTRNMSYIKPLNAPMGPKQTKCEIKDEMEHQDLDDYITTVTSTRTPDVPSGGVFSVKTRTCITWAGPISSKVLVTTQVEWTGRSFIKGIIERSAIDGQKVYHGDLEKAMRAYIQEHHSEFVPEGIDTAELEAAVEEAKDENIKESESGPAPTSGGNAGNITQEEREKRREHERNLRAWQWLLDTFEGAFSVAKQSTKTAWDLVRDAWDQSSSTTILYFVIVFLVISNLYTLIRMGKKEDVGRRKEMMKQEERERWVQNVVNTLWLELAAGKQEALGLRESFPPHPPLSLSTIIPSSSLPDSLETPLPPVESLVATPGSWKEEVAHLHQTLALVEERIKSIKSSLAEFEKFDNLD